MTASGTVLGFYQDQDAANLVLKALRSRRYRRSAAIHHAEDGRISVDDYDVSPYLAAFLGGFCGFLVGLLLGLLLQPVFPIRNPFNPYIPLLTLSVLGALAGSLLARLLDFGVQDALIARYRRWIVRNETLLIVQVAPRDMGRVLELLRQASNSAPITFAFHPEPAFAAQPDEEIARRSPLTLEQLRQSAAQLATTLPSVSSRSVQRRPLNRHLRASETTLKYVQETLADASRTGQAISMSAEWLLDNAYILQGHIDDFQRHLPRRYYEELPVITEGDKAGFPRVYGIASELVANTNAQLDRSHIHNFLESYQSVTPLTIGELWALPLLLRLSLIEWVRYLAIQVHRREREREQADFWANRLLTAARLAPDRLTPFVTELTREHPDPSLYLVDQLIGYLYDEDHALAAAREWLERRLNAPLPNAILQEHINQTAEQVTLANAITSLRQLGHLDWRDLFETLSRVDMILWTDPASVYSQMNFATRDYYRHAVEEMARCSNATECEIALEALKLADEGTDALTQHIGYYLRDQGRETLEARIGCKPKFSQRMQRWTRRHATLVYLSGVALSAAGFVTLLLSVAAGAGVGPGLLGLLGVLALLPAGELAVQSVNYLVTRLMPPQFLPKMSFEEGIPDACRTLVIIPMMLLTPESIREEVEHLEIRYLANSDSNLRFGLLSDFSDAPQKEMPEDMERLDVVVQAIKGLNDRYGQGRFFLFHRERRWSESEERWIGWERKRGKLEHLNRFLMGERSPELDNLLHVGDAAQLRGIRFVITLDSDTQLPRDAARQMIETLAHPLNRPQLSPDGRKVERGYTIIQPRVSTSLPSATATLFSRIFTDTTGTDPYTHVISDVYQDLMGEGSYHGKGIYDLQAFHQILSGRFPESHLLSHDLLEGAHVRVGLASDIELLDFFPRDYSVYANRQHRWTRGDWQIVDWLLPRVPTGKGGSEPNPLSLFNRWKIADNLRRSLLPVALVALLLFGWFCTPVAAPVSLFVGMVLLLPPLTSLITRLTTRPILGLMMGRELGNGLLRATFQAALLPHQALLTLDAVGRVCYRRMVSHRLLLEWQTAQETHRNARNRQARFLYQTAWISLCFLVVTLILPFLAPAADAAAQPFLALWIISPLLIAWLHTSMRSRPTQDLTSAERRMLRQVARQTWRYFNDFMGPQTNWLPPDNYQEFLRAEVAQRTSPTNIGLGLLATLVAHDFGYITLDEMIERTLATMQTLGKLERYEGHLLNWYDIQTLEPLWPRYVSMVDSGNLLGNLWALEQGMDELLSRPLLGQSALQGLKDTLDLLQQIPLPAPDGIQKIAPEKPLTTLGTLLNAPPQGLEEIVRCIREAATPACMLVKALHERCPDNAVCRYWTQQIEQQTTAWNEVADRYLGWVEILASPPKEGLLALGPDAHEWRRQALAAAPSLRALAAGDVAGLHALIALQRRSEELNLSETLRAWLDALEKATSQAQWLAGERIAQAEATLAQMRALADGMNMRFLYDAEQSLFFTGYNVSERRMDMGHYNLLASEARLGSFLAVARGEVPIEHWWSLGRPYGAAYNERALLSWSGTMFEYLMPLLLTRSFENSLLDQACKAAVACQIAYGRRRNIPWGISEAAYSAVDAHLIYQYRAFGVPGLGLRRGLEEDLVVAPYASALALAVYPQAATQNLHRLSRLARLGMRGGYGYYEAIDYTRQQEPKGERGVIVYAYMAHHQGMILAAIDNALNNDILQERFHRDPRVRATESLLYERIPTAPAVSKESVQKELLPKLTPLVSVPFSGPIETPNTATPKTNLLSNGAYSVMVTNAGGGYSHWRDVEITRWRADTTCDAYGAFCYIKDKETGAVWANAYQPVRSQPQRYTVTFTADKAEFRRRDNGIETITEIVVSPEDNVEVRRITLTNRSRRKRRIELTSYMEIALAPHNADRAHPAFSKLFVRTEALPEQDALLAWRRPRSADTLPVWAVHVVAADASFEATVSYETDRARFLGRGRAPDRPEALEGELSQTDGAVLDPIFSLRRAVSLEAGQRVQIAFVTGAAESREEAVALAEKYKDLRAAHRALEMAWTHAQLELRHLRIHQDEAQLFQQLAAHVLYPNALLRPSSERLARNTLGQSRLWAHGISGDLPIVIVTIGDAQDIDLVRQALMAHAYWLVRGLKADLVILNEEAVTYDQPLQHQLRRLIEAHSDPASIEKPGGVFLRPVAQIPEEERALFLTSARAVLVAARGSLAQQLGAPAQIVTLPPSLATNARIKEEPSSPLPFMELPYFNGLGGFTPDGKEYAIYLGPGSRTPMPWVNVLANPSFGALVSESGAGLSWYGNSQSNRLTPWSNDPISDPGGDALYIRDEDLGVFWTPTPLPIREDDAYRTRHGQGYTLFEHNSHAIEQELTTFVPMDAEGGAPLRLQRLRLTNRSSRKRKLTVTFYCEWALGTEREETQIHVRTQWDTPHQLLLARNPYHADFGGRVAFVASNLPVASYTGDRTEFLGRNGAMSSPTALTRVRLSGRVGAGLDPCAALQVVVEIEPQQQAEVLFLLGQAADAEQAVALAQQYRNLEAFEQALQVTRNWWDTLLETIQVETPDQAVNFLLNRWLLYQDLSCRLWGRSAFYQSGGAYGFRDQLQDVMALVYAAPQIAREQILRTAARQFTEGDVQHWWHPPSGAGVRTRISDDLLWLPFVTAQYIRVTGDAGILDAKMPFLEGKTLAEHEHEAFFVPAVSPEEASLLEHCRRAISKGLTAGPHGLPLIGGGDWNDGLNRVGIEGKGESVWLAWFLIHVLNDFAELLELRGEKPEAEACRTQATRLAETVETQAWDGEWYRRAYFDDGTPMGSKQNAEAQIDSLAQSWGVLSGAADPARVAMAMHAVEERLVRKEEGMTLLFTPPFDKSSHDPGYIKGYPPGVRENGGQYTHGSLWVPMAFAQQGEGDKAVSLLRMMNPVEHTRLPEDVQRYKVEPYVVAADIYALEGRKGQGGWTWYTGSAGWMYRAWLEEVLGFRLRGDKLILDPCFASAWAGFTLRYRYKSAVYGITVENPDSVCRGVCCIEVDGKTLVGTALSLQDDGQEHSVRVRLSNHAS